MARNVNLEDVIEAIFFDDHSYSKIDRWNRNDGSPTTMLRYMEIPLNGDVFELPLLAFTAFRNMCKDHIESNFLVAQLFSCGRTSQYKSLDSIMKDCLSADFSKHLIEVQVPGTSTIYYVTSGAVFDKDFKPLMMLSWLLERKTDGDGRIKYHYKKPLLRLNPEICVGKEDSVQRFLSGKLMTTGLSTIIRTPYFDDSNSFMQQTPPWAGRDTHHLKVEIDQSPFVIRGIEAPSISVTNKDLLQLAADHIDEMIQ